MSNNSQAKKPIVGKQFKLSFEAAKSLRLYYQEKRALHKKGMDLSYHPPLEFTPKKCEKSGKPIEQCDICSEHGQ